MNRVHGGATSSSPYYRTIDFRRLISILGPIPDYNIDFDLEKLIHSHCLSGDSDLENDFQRSRNWIMVK